MTFPIYIAIIGNGHSDVLYHYIFVDFNAEKFKCAKFLLDNMDYLPAFILIIRSV